MKGDDAYAQKNNVDYSQLIGKYLQLGLIEADEAALMKERLAEQNVFGRGFGNDPGKMNGFGRPFGETN